ncbi:MAG: MFS transporter, partial [Lachnospiraceae bacterium]|nr:MFS transporter [Lachnospiraceae bacterium]
MRRRDYLGDAMGQFALNLMSTIVGQLTYFYTDKVGMAAGAVASMFLFCKILDAFSGLIVGNWMDHAKPKLGKRPFTFGRRQDAAPKREVLNAQLRSAPGKEKYRPWLLKGGIPAGIALVLLFTVPDVGDAGRLAYALITNILLSTICYTLISIPYSSLMIVRTDNQEERSMMGTCRAGAGYISGMVIVFGIFTFTYALGGTE